MERAARSADPRPASILLGFSLLVTAVGVFLAFLDWGDPAEGLESICLFGVGGLGLLSFARHSIYHRSDAARMRMETRHRNNFQIEVGFANLAWGLLAFAAVGWDWGVTAQAALTLVFAVYLLSAASLLVLVALDPDEPRSGPDAWAPVVNIGLTAAFLAFFALRALADADVDPF